MADIDLSLIIPCYNEEKILEQNIKEVFKILDSSHCVYEIIFVDDCSKDNTREIIKRISSNFADKRITQLPHETNTGRGGAVMDGVRASRGKIVGFIDIDLEVHARYIPSCVLAVKDGFDIAVIRRIYKFYFKSFIRYFMSKGYIFLVRWLLNVPLQDTESGFKFFDRKRLEPIMDEIAENGWFWDTEIMVRSYLQGYRIKEIPGCYIRNFGKKSTVQTIPDTLSYLGKLLKFRKLIQDGKQDKAIRDYWQDRPRIFANACKGRKNFFVNDFLQKREKYIAAFLDIKEGVEAIDVGCGSGVYSKILLKKGARVTGTDYSKKMLDICDSELKNINSEGYSLINCEADSLLVADNKFDLLLSIGLLDYVNDINKTLAEFRRVVKPKGKIIFSVPKRNSPFFFLRSRWGSAIRRNIFNLPCIKNTLTKRQIEETISKAGLSLKRADSFYATMWVVKCERLS